MPTRVLTPRRPRRNGSLVGLLVLSASIVAAGILMRGGQRPEAIKERPVYVGEFDTVSVPVPVDPIPAGTALKMVTFRTVKFPRHQVPENALTDVAPYLEAVTAAPLPASLPLFPENLSHTALGKNPVIERIPPGMRAMTIQVDATSSVEGWAGSGSIVDVLLVTPDRTTVVAEKVKILSTERSVSPVEGSAAPSVPTTATLLVTQEQCLAINTAIPLGKIAFALRSAKDEEGWRTTSLSSDNIHGTKRGVSHSGEIQGYVAIGKGHRSFALSDGKWIQTEVVPEGFLVNRGE